MVNKLDLVRKRLKAAENTLARLQGEESALQKQLDEAKEKMAGLGVSEEEAPAYLKVLEEEEKQLLAELEVLEKTINRSLDEKTAPADLGGAAETDSLLTTLDL